MCKHWQIYHIGLDGVSLPLSSALSFSSGGRAQEEEGHLVKTQKGVDRRGLSPNPVEHKRREKKGFERESLST